MTYRGEAEPGVNPRIVLEKRMASLKNVKAGLELTRDLELRKSGFLPGDARRSPIVDKYIPLIGDTDKEIREIQRQLDLMK